MKKLCWAALFVVAVLMAVADRFSVRLEPGDSHLIYSFPAWTEQPWFEIDTRHHDDG